MTTETQAPDPAPATWKLVPIEPTAQMLAHAEKTLPEAFSIGDEYRAMLAVAPSFPAPEGAQLPEPAFTLRWDEHSGQYKVNKPGINYAECYTADQMRAALAAQSDWAGAGAFIQHVQNAAGSTGADGHWPDEFLAWYKPADWLGEHRAAAVFLGSKIAALAAPAPQAPVALPDLDLCKLISSHEVFQYHPGALHEFSHAVIAEFCRVNGIKEPTNDR